MKIVYNKLLPFRGYKAMTLWPFMPLGVTGKPTEASALSRRHIGLRGTWTIGDAGGDTTG